MNYSKRDIALRSLEFMGKQLVAQDEPMARYIEGVLDTGGEGYSDMELGVLFKICQDFYLFCTNGGKS